MGTGVGLAVSLGIVQSPGGSLQASNSTESGAQFIRRLPPSKRREVALGAAEEAACASDSCCVLVVDDEPEVSERLAGAGHGSEYLRAGLRNSYVITE